MSKMIRRFLKDERGATAIEYSLIAGLVALAIVGGVGSLRNQLIFLWSSNEGEITKGLNAH